MSDPILSARTATILLYQGDDQARLDELAAEVDRARVAGSPSRLNDVDGYAAAVDAYRDFASEAKDRAVAVVVRALGRRQWRSLVDAHPVREGNERDAAYGVNFDSFGDALVPPSIAAPEFTTPADRDAFLDGLSDVDFGRLYQAAFALNRVPATDPKDLIAFAAIRSSDETLN